MSYSLSLTDCAPSDFAEQLDTKIAELPDGAGKDEALKHRVDLLDVLTLVSDHIDTNVNASCSGSAGATWGSFSVSVSAVPAESSG